MKKTTLSIALLLATMASGLHAENLLGVYDLAMQNDPVLREAQKRRDAVMEVRPQAKAGLLPNVGLGGSLEQVRRETDALDEDYSENSLGLNLTQALYRRDRMLAVKQADNVIAQAEAEYASAETDLMLRTATAYFNVLAAEDALKFRTAERVATKRQLEQAQQRFEVGLIAITSVHEAQAAFDGARANEIQAENDLDNAKEALREITGGAEVSLSRLGEKLQLSSPEPADIEQWAKTARDQNYSIIAAKESSESLKKDIEIQNSGHYPSVDLVGSLSHYNTGSSLLADADTASVGVELNLPLYAGGSVTSRTRQARYNYEASLEVLEQRSRSVNRQVRDAYRGVQSSISRVGALEAATRSAESALESTQAGFEVGTRTMVDVLNQQRTLFQAKADYARARYDYVITALQLRQAASLLERADLERVNGWLE